MNFGKPKNFITLAESGAGPTALIANWANGSAEVIALGEHSIGILRIGTYWLYIVAALGTASTSCILIKFEKAEIILITIDLQRLGFGHLGVEE